MARLLIVDDDPALVRLITLLLRVEDYDVVGVRSGQEGLDEIARDTPDLIVLDLMMPRMDGREFYHKARASGYEGPIIVCSAFNPQQAQTELGAEGAIEKPFETDVLLALVTRLLAEGKRRSNGCETR